MIRGTRVLRKICSLTPRLCLSLGTSVLAATSLHVCLSREQALVQAGTGPCLCVPCCICSRDVLGGILACDQLSVNGLKCPSKDEDNVQSWMKADVSYHPLEPFTCGQSSYFCPHSAITRFRQLLPGGGGPGDHEYDCAIVVILFRSPN